MELTDRYIRALVVDKRREIPDESFRHGKKRRGLVLLAETSGNHKFLYKRMVKGARHNFTLGAYPDLSLAIARERVDDINDYDGSPSAAWQALFAPTEKPEVMTVDRLINSYIEKECEPYNRDWANQQVILKRELQPYLSMPADEMTVDHVLDIVQGCLDRGSPRTAQEALKQVRGMYNWAMGKKRVRRRVVSKEEATQALVRKVIVKMAKNPAEGVIAPEYKARHYHLRGKALSSFTKKLAASNLRDDCKLILLIQLQTFCRVGEVSGMRWDEINLKKRVWVTHLAQHLVVLQGGLEEKPQSGNGDIDDVTGSAVGDHMQLEAPEIFCGGRIRRTLQEPGESLDRTEVCLLCPGLQLTQDHIVDHALA